MKKSSFTVISFSLFCIALTGCGKGTYDIDSETDRAAMKIDILNALTSNDCKDALVLSTQLYTSVYSDNSIRMLYASSHGCNIGINGWTLANSFASWSTTNPIGQFARDFPSTTSDSKLQSTWFATDALQASIAAGSVVSPVDELWTGTHNVGSVYSFDQTTDAQVYMLYVGIAAVGTILNRYGAPDASYMQGAVLDWETLAKVQADTTNTACALASGFLNFFDGAHAAATLNTSVATNVNKILVLLENALVTTDPLRAAYGGNAHCLSDGYSQAVCDTAHRRLRYRGACAESAAAASFAAGIIGAVNDIWL